MHSFSGDDFRICRDFVAEAIGLPRDRWRERREPDQAEVERRLEARRRAEARDRNETARLQRRAVAIWNEAGDPAGSVVERYLKSRALDLPPEVAGDVIRFHLRCPWETGTAPAMVAAMRCVRTGAITAVHRTALSPEGSKLGRKMFGTAGGAAVMLDAEEEITTGLAIGEGIETVLAARQLGIRPAWALGSLFPVLPG
ncbi:DUF7146 domain-containing protein, partial [Methylobacterium thuringiense]|uniref:DUF7146 domain-containing protein n=1 Tax=Methylobacterium thuringiense TaxID=1003091 RepID=UPI00402B0C5B